MQATCTKCGTPFQMGIDGIETPQGDQCDKCARITRAANGYALEETETPRCTCCDPVHYGDNPHCPIHGAQHVPA